MKKILVFGMIAIVYLLGFQVYTQTSTLMYTMSVIGETMYDLQSNFTCQSRLYLHSDGTLGAVFTMGNNPSSFPDRGTGYSYFNGTTWSAIPYNRIENQKTGWPSYAPWGVSGEIVVSHLGSVSGLKISKRASKGSGTWTFSNLTGPVQNPNLLWARMVSGEPSHEYTHVLAITASLSNGGVLVNGQDGALQYSRSSDGGVTWGILNASLPQTGAANYTGFKGEVYSMAEPKGNNLAIVAGDNWLDVFLLKSTDNGQTWTKTMIFQHPYPFFNETTTLVLDTPTVCDGNLAVALDNDGKAHVFFGLMRVLNDDLTDGTTSYFPYTDGLVYWNEDMSAFTTLDYDSLLLSGNLVGWAPDPNGNGILDITGLGAYYCSVTSQPTVSIDSNNIMLLVMSTLFENLDNGNQNYRHLLGRVSMDKGISWLPPFNLNNSILFNFSECVFPCLSPTSDEDFHLIFMADEEPGMAVRGDNDPFTTNYIYYMKIDKDSILPLDVGVTAIMQPTTGPGLSQEVVEIKVKNYSQYPVYNIPVGYSVDGGPFIMEIMSGPINPLNTANYTFLATVDLSMPGYTYMLNACTFMAGDTMPANNCHQDLITHVNTIQVAAPTLGTCPGAFAFPVTVADFYNVASLALALEYNNTVLTYTGYQNVDPALYNGTLIVSQLNNKVHLNWSSLTPVSIGGGTLLELIFDGNPGVSPLIWDQTTPGACQFQDANNNNIPYSAANGAITVTQCSDLDGTVTYDNLAGTPMTNTTVFLKQSGNIIRQTNTDNQGYYFMDGLNSGTYQLDASCSKPWGGGNAADGLRILQHFTGMSYLSGLKKKAGDVDGSGLVNAADALFVAKRFVLMVSSFPVGNWIFRQDTVVIPFNASVNHSFKALCYGDVDGSYTPGLKNEPGIVFSTSGGLQVNPHEMFRIPLIVNEKVSLAALSLAFTYPEEEIRISDIFMNTPEDAPGELVYQAGNGQCRLAWYSLLPLALEQGETLLEIESSLISNTKALHGLVFEVLPESEISDIQGNRLDRVSLSLPSVSIRTGGEFSGILYPNPAGDYALLNLNLPENGQGKLLIYNSLGEKMLEQEETRMEAGKHQWNLPLGQFPSGIYSARFVFEGQQSHYQWSDRLIIR